MRCNYLHSIVFLRSSSNVLASKKGKKMFMATLPAQPGRPAKSHISPKKKKQNCGGGGDFFFSFFPECKNFGYASIFREWGRSRERSRKVPARKKIWKLWQGWKLQCLSFLTFRPFQYTFLSNAHAIKIMRLSAVTKKTIRIANYCEY